MTAIALALCASTLWGVGDFLGGLSSRRIAALTVLAVSELAGWLAVVAVVAIARPELPGGTAAGAAVLAGIGGVVGLGALYRGMAVGAMGVVAPISAAAAVIPIAVGLARGERPGSVQLAGMALVLAGVVLVSREPGAGGGPARGGRRPRAARGGRLRLLLRLHRRRERGRRRVGGARLARRRDGARVRRRVRPRSGWPPTRALPTLIAVGLFDVSANGLLALALNEGLVSLVAVLASLYPVVTLALAATVLGERISRTQALGAAVALTGVAFISAG